MSDGTQYRGSIPTERIARAQLCAVAIFAFVALALPAAAPAAADPCPNAAVRAQQGSQHLPDCRAYEMVSQADKNGYQVNMVWPSSPDGNRIAYRVFGGVPGSPAGISLSLATRGDDGWVSSSLRPPAAESLADQYLIGATATDMSSVIATAFDGLGTGQTADDQSVVRLNEGGQQDNLFTFDSYFGSSGVELIASDDASRVFLNSKQALDVSQQPGTWSVYEIGSGVPELVSAMPLTGEAPQCGVPALEDPASFPDSSTGGVQEHWVSTDGSRLFFMTRGDDDPDCDDPLRLYVRDVDADTTTQITGDPVGGDPDSGVWRFLQATPDGSAVFFSTVTSYDAADSADADAEDMDVYRWTQAGGNVCLTCVVPNAAVFDIDQVNRPVVSEDGSHVYFSSAAQLADAPDAGDEFTPNTYVLYNGVVGFIAKTNGIASRPRNGGQATPDGNVLIFRANTPEMDAVSGSSNGGFFQYYRYDDQDGSVTCVSCPAGTATVDVFDTLAFDTQAVPARTRAVTDDGSMVFFTTAEKLTLADVNGKEDIYEWHDGAIGLITSGKVDYPAFVGPFVTSITADGRDVFFIDQGRLTAEAQDTTAKLYTARIGGGFETTTPPAPCGGEGCLGPPSPGAGAGALGSGSDSFAGEGNPGVRQAKARKCPKGKRKVRRGAKTRCVSKKNARKNPPSANRRASR